jgi:Fur family ferric uptake transcriptional regulator
MNFAERFIPKLPKNQPRREELRALFRAARLRCTTARLEIVGQLRHASRSLSHAEIASALTPLRIDRTTVYRNLVELSAAGLLLRLDFGDHIWRFEFRGVANRAQRRKGQLSKIP